MPRIRWLLLALPASWALTRFHAAPLPVFVVTALAIVPLAAEMGEATESLAGRAGPGVGGLLNATFGNAAEVIVALAALRAGLTDLVKASLTGSILGNLLLILGLSLVAGGVRQPTLRFNRTAAGMIATTMVLAVVGLVMPALFVSVHPEARLDATMRLSEGVALVLGLTYLAGLVFSLVTHRHLLGLEARSEPPVGMERGLWRPVGVLAGATALVAVQSEILVRAAEAVVVTVGVSETFLGLIIIPLIGNAAEHATGVVVAARGQTDLALSIALGSSAQVALFVAPLLVGAGILLGRPMDLVFSGFEVVAVALASLIVNLIALDGESHWFEGVQLLSVYAILAVVGWFI